MGNSIKLKTNVKCAACVATYQTSHGQPAG